MLSDKIMELRKNKNISQEELALVLDTSRQAISKYERGEAYPDIDKLLQIAKYFNVSVDYLLDYDMALISSNKFIEKINKCFENNVFDIRIEEIKEVIARNINDFNLHIEVVNYLFRYISNKVDKDCLDLLIDYLKRCLIIFQEDNKYGVTKSNILESIITVCLLDNRLESAKQIIVENNMKGVNIALSFCELGLNNYEKAKELASETYIETVINLININIIQTLILFKDNKINEAYELVLWCINFINSIGKNNDSMLEVSYIFIILRCILEKYLQLDYQDTMKYIKDIKSKMSFNTLTTDAIKYLYTDDKSPMVFIKDIKGLSDFVLRSSKDTLVYQDAKEVFAEVMKDE